MEKQSKFELFQKNKIEGLQSIVGGARATVVTGGNRPEWIGHGDTWYDFTEHNKTSAWSGGWGDGDLVVSVSPGGNPDPNDADQWTELEPNSVIYKAM